MNGPKKLYRLDKGAMLAGVCGGIAEYFNIDPSIVRIIAAILFFAGGLSLWVYVIAAIILPKKSDVYPGY
ncbi:MAG: PspC domain-containing protein [Oscillospiraceae bacterium]